MSQDRAQSGEAPREQSPRLDLGVTRRISARDYGMRFAFGFAISVCAALVTMGGGPRMGGLFLAFPAILPATLTLMEKKEGIAQAASDVRGAAIGAAAMIGFAAIAASQLLQLHLLALPAALATWIVVSALLYLTLRGVIQLLGEKQYLAEIPIAEAAPVVEALQHRNLTLACAETAPGGVLSGLLTQLPDSQRVLRTCEVLPRRETPSRDRAIELASSVRTHSGADLGLALAMQPDGGGQSWIALVGSRGVLEARAVEEQPSSSRATERAVRSAIQVVVDSVGGHAQG